MGEGIGREGALGRALRGLGLGARGGAAAPGAPGAPKLVLGRCERTGAEIALSGRGLRDHLLVLGGAAGERREVLFSAAEGALDWGGGFALVDASGDVSTYARAHGLCARAGRLSDLLVLNFMGGMSMRMNPFRNGSPGALAQFVLDGIDPGDGDGGLWKRRAAVLVSSVLGALCWMRDRGMIHLDAAVVRAHVGFGRVVGLADGEECPDLPERIRASIGAYLNSLPGYREGEGRHQPRATVDQHGCLEMFLDRRLRIMADVHGHVFARGGADVDFEDLVRNRRVLVAMTHSLDRADAESRVAAAAVVCAIKGALGAMLARSGAGAVGASTGAGPDVPPFLLLFDGAGAYCPGGMALMSAQARSAGVMGIYACGSVSELTERDPNEGRSIAANTATRLLLRAGDAATLDLVAAGVESPRGLRREATSLSQGDAYLCRAGQAVRVRLREAERGGSKWLDAPKPLSLDWDIPEPGIGIVAGNAGVGDVA